MPNLYPTVALQERINRLLVVFHSRTKTAMSLIKDAIASMGLSINQGLQKSNQILCFVLTCIPRFDSGYITWISSGEAVWTIYSGGLGPDTETEIGARIIPQEPMVSQHLSHSEHENTDHAM
jgi:hypothetical protein